MLGNILQFMSFVVMVAGVVALRSMDYTDTRDINGDSMPYGQGILVAFLMVVVLITATYLSWTFSLLSTVVLFGLLFTIDYVKVGGWLRQNLRTLRTQFPLW